MTRAESSQKALHEQGRLTFLERARSIAPLISQEANAIEEGTKVTDRVVAVLRETQLFWMALPKHLGGGGASLTESVEVIEEIARADASTGWAYFATSFPSAGFAAMLDERAADVMYRKGELAITAGMPAPIGKIEKVAGGYRGGGRFSFASGSDFANWIGFGATVMEGGKPLLGAEGAPVTRYCFVPRSQVVFKGNWNVMGLKGTGSYDYEIRDAFVPEELALDLFDPERPPEKRLYKLAAGDLVIGHAPVALGGMKRVLQEIAQIASSKTRLGYTGKVADSDTFRLDFARHEAKYQGARAYLFEVCRQIEATGKTREGVTPELSARIRQVNTWMHEVAREVAVFAHGWGGSQGIRNPSVLGRCTLDLMTAATHALMDPATLVAAAPALIRSWH